MIRLAARKSFQDGRCIMGCLRSLDTRSTIKERTLRVTTSIHLPGRRGNQSHIYKGHNVHGANIFDNRITILLNI